MGEKAAGCLSATPRESVTIAMQSGLGRDVHGAFANHMHEDNRDALRWEIDNAAGL